MRPWRENTERGETVKPETKAEVPKPKRKGKGRAKAEPPAEADAELIEYEPVAGMLVRDVVMTTRVADQKTRKENAERRKTCR